ncbi:7TM GPCR serpentine receptor class x (Srx) domain-containing protein [Caenorhabditis elegans]|uniref:7TM GPCR serpentine receptor class x (Srx) domain-containing protein n=1 Tax=Caenorhabditis elegans TaxID=6239 RepID=O17877_CAEEL|nr:7TM GPCR serpentine receptor class x (Srx) domain-containing protein [Caenorhabditis elegans]CAB04431.2 7TM GPCR serpentine receptor class x (Srx) domain-containing protein [Caenorhabditis elegans]|eukprot:NP_496677.2 Serpentine Receptor, class X [Caenorhabditis elegans]
MSSTSFWDAFLYSEFSNPSTRTVSAVMLILVCTVGSIVNCLIFFATLLRISKRDGFLKICCFNSFGSSIVCIGYLAFPVPSLLMDGYPNHWLNAIMGQLIGWFGWSIGPLSQILLATNRITAVYFPLWHMKKYRFNPTNFGIGFSLLIALFSFAVLLPEGCHYLFNRDYLGWIGEVTPCTEVAQEIFFIIMLFITGATTFCSVLLFIKLIMHSPDPHVSNAQLTYRHKKNRRMIIQAIVQSILIIVDSLNSTITYNMFPNLFFQFITLSFSMVFLRTVEGFVVFSINTSINAAVKKMIGIRTLVQIGKTIFVAKNSNSTGPQRRSIPII